MRRVIMSLALSLLLYSICAWAGTPLEVLLLAEATYPEGTYEVPMVTIPTGYTSGHLKLTRGAWVNPAACATWHVYVSLDSGTTWLEPHLAGRACGGVTTSPGTGGPSAYNMVGTELPQPTNPNRRFRGTVVVSGAPVTTAVYAVAR
jgi:hypothetical protein